MNFRFETGLNATLQAIAEPSRRGFALGQLIEPGDPDTYDQICTAGWSGVEWDGVWNEQERAVLRILLAPSDAPGPLAVWLQVRPFNPAGHVQTVSVRCDGVDMGRAALVGEGDEPLVLQIVQGGPPSARTHVRLEIGFPDRLSPAARGLSPDQRELGVQLQRLAVTAAAASAPAAFTGEPIRFEPAAAAAAIAGLSARVDALAAEARESRRLLELMHDQLAVSVRRSDDLLLQSAELVRRSVIPLGQDAVACRTPHGYVLASPQDAAALLVLADTGDLEPGVRALFERFVDPGMQVVDAGANLGVHTLALARLVGPGGRVHAFEPEPRNLSLLRRTLALNGMEGRTQVHGAALGERAGAGRLYLGRRGGLHSLYPLAPSEGAVDVAVETLDQALGDSPPLDLLKLDVEGAEVAALKGGSALIRRSPDIVIMAEYAPSHLARAGLGGAQWFEAFAQLGFDRIFVVEEPHGDCRPYAPQGDDRAESLNLLFVRAGSERLARIAARGP